MRGKAFILVTKFNPKIGVIKFFYIRGYAASVIYNCELSENITKRVCELMHFRGIMTSKLLKSL